MVPNDKAILEIRDSINRRRRRRDLVTTALQFGGLVASIAVVGLLLVSCATGPVIAECPPDRCLGPYDLTLSSHREALDVER